ncbi:MAG TPA: lipoprotein signal peptidase [Chitinophagales bacterium]|nr:lipoprotein signal peptidase [Chitinophagales bacterium]
MGTNKSAVALAIVVLVLLIDQISKIWIKTHLMIGEEIHVFEWFKIHFVENEGMAFGLRLGGDYGKLALSVFRIVAVFFLIIILRSIIRKPDTTTGLVASMALILSGAIGNIIDSAIYGVLFSDSHNQIATFLPAGGGYAPPLYGKVVDMLHFPIYQGWLPTWIPIWGGDYFMFFRPVFNIADTAITLGVFSILLFQRNFFAHLEEDKAQTDATDLVPDAQEQEEATANINTDATTVASAQTANAEPLRHENTPTQPPPNPEEPEDKDSTEKG